MCSQDINSTKKDITILLSYSIEANKGEVMITVATCPLDNTDNSITWQIDKLSIFPNSF